MLVAQLVSKFRLLLYYNVLPAAKVLEDHPLLAAVSYTPCTRIFPWHITDLVEEMRKLLT